MVKKASSRNNTNEKSSSSQHASSSSSLFRKKRARVKERDRDLKENRMKSNTTWRVNDETRRRDFLGFVAHAPLEASNLIVVFFSWWKNANLSSCRVFLFGAFFAFLRKEGARVYASQEVAFAGQMQMTMKRCENDCDETLTTLTTVNTTRKK